MNYLLVSECDENGDWDEEAEDAYAFILKESESGDDSEESTYVEVQDDDELISVSRIFEQLMEDMDFEVE